jgi:hypothetical protein
MDITRIISISLSVGIFLFVVWLIRERRLREKYALLWLFTSIVIIALAASRHILEVTALAVGIYYPPSLLFLLGLLFLLIVTIGHSISLSRLSHTNLKLVQEIALLRKELDEVKQVAPGAEPEAEKDA